MPLPKRAGQTDSEVLNTIATLTKNRAAAEAGVQDALTVSTTGTIYGCCGLFDLCGDMDLMSLSLEGTSKFLDWIGWEMTNVCRIRKNFIAWVRPTFEDGNQTPGDGCSETCTIEGGGGPICGNNVLEQGEECDDGNQTPGDG